ncbi:MAG: YbhB/YbcL family Raf kinase inhibitor-like protein [Chitinivibrionales bacterium]|nr:YbhB/YbcL family Raf kinase inhibitor-like protein [Chitinivibrionales bacterium]MBD3356558.1 YbhB/YbcL family Raf kinase inhibitor-like protein [Chitinivibrionales bacterium]
MKLSSPAFENADLIPKKYTCNGDNVSPPLSIENIPQNTGSLTLIVDDPDAPGGTFVHWVLYNIPPASSIAEGSVPGSQGINSFKKTGYGGPCPPSGTHRYFFKLYALDDELGLDQGCTKQEVIQAMDGHIIGSAELVGRYGSP